MPQRERTTLTIEEAATSLGISSALACRPVADFYDAVMFDAERARSPHQIWATPVEIVDAIPFPGDRVHRQRRPEALRRFRQAVVEMTRVFKQFRIGFVGKSSPVHLFWASLDLAHTRFSGRTAPAHPGGAPNCGPHVCGTRTATR